MAEQDVGRLREQLRGLGYLSHGIDRWFALDPWSSRTFWSELLLITAKAATIASPFAVLPVLAVMLLRNGALPAWETTLLVLVYLAAAFVLISVIVLATAALLKIRPGAVIERPGSLFWVSLTQSGIVVAVILTWWLGFPSRASAVEIAIMIASVLLFLPIGTIAFSAALLSFSIYETQRIPSIHRRSRTVPLTVAGGVMLVLLLFLIPAARPVAGAEAPSQVVIRPTEERVVLLAVDGLTRQIFEARNRTLTISSFRSPLTGSAPEVWATEGTGTPTQLHGVRSIEAVRFAGGHRLIQAVSSVDFVLTDLSAATRLTQRLPLPPTVRQRHYVWEILGARGVKSLAVNWWATAELEEPNLRVLSQESIYAGSAKSPVELAAEIDQRAQEAMKSGLSDSRFATAYLPGLDIVLNRLELDDPARLAASVRLLDQLDAMMRSLNDRTVLVAGNDFVAANRQIAGDSDPMDLAPTVLDLFGFPASQEMPGRSLLPGSAQPRIGSYGSRQVTADTSVDQDYYDKLRSLGYVN